MSPVTFSCRRPEEALLWSNHGIQPWGPRHCGPGRGPVQNGAYGQTSMTSILCPQGLQHSSEHWEPWGDSCCPGRGWAQVVQRQPASDFEADPHLHVQVTAGACSLSDIVMWPLSTLPGLGGFFDHDCSHSYVQLSCYDQAKQLVLSTGYLSDNIFTHFVSSFIAVSAPHGVGVGVGWGMIQGACGVSLMQPPFCHI